MSKCVGECLDCGVTFDQSLRLCPKCNSKNIKNTLTLTEEIKVHEGTKRKEGRGENSKESLDETKIGGDGIEVKQSRVIDRVNHRYAHSVSKQNENGEWVEFHHEDETLSEHNKKALLKNKQSKKP